MSWLRPSEWLLLAYFCYAAVFSGALMPQGGFVLGGVAAAAVLSRGRPWAASRWTGIVRDWLPAPLVLVAYWAVDWFSPPASPYHYEHAWIGLDRLILNAWGLKAAVESLGPVLPSLLELCYSLLYAVTPVSIGVLYLYRRRDRVDQFLFTLLLGTLATYALLPHFASLPPTLVFPGENLPAATTPFRMLNLWLLGQWDIRISVFPSGHVTLGFSAAFAMLLALPKKRRVGWALLVIAFGVAVATVYGRYHYAVDGLAGLGVSLLAAAAARLFYPRIARRAE